MRVQAAVPVLSAGAAEAHAFLLFSPIFSRLSLSPSVFLSPPTRFTGAWMGDRDGFLFLNYLSMPPLTFCACSRWDAGRGERWGRRCGRGNSVVEKHKF
jgi:hypothetical protein